MIRTKTTNVTGTADIKAFNQGSGARIVKISIQNTGTVGTEGTIEFREAVAGAGDTGTLRWSVEFGSVADDVLEIDFPYTDVGGGLQFADGIHVVVTAVTNFTMWVMWEG